jgi:hypothetical protein
MTSLADTPGPQGAAEVHLHRLGDAHPHVAGEPRVGHVGAAHTEREASQGAGHARVRVGARHHLAGQRDVFDDGVVADGLRALAHGVLDLAVVAHALGLGEALLHDREAAGDVLEAHLHVLRGHHVVEEGEVVAEGVHARGVGHPRVVAEGPAEERVGHGGDVLVGEANVGAHEEASPGATAATPTRSAARSVTAWAARIFSARVMGRAGVVRAGGDTSPAVRALLYSNSPPYRTMSAEMGSSPRVNSARGMASPRAIRGKRPKSVLVSSPMFCAFCP